jgi:hypothetical protein
LKGAYKLPEEPKKNAPNNAAASTGDQSGTNTAEPAAADDSHRRQDATPQKKMIPHPGIFCPESPIDVTQDIQAIRESLNTWEPLVKLKKEEKTFEQKALEQKTLAELKKQLRRLIRTYTGLVGFCERLQPAQGMEHTLDRPGVGLYTLTAKTEMQQHAVNRRLSDSFGHLSHSTETAPVWCDLLDVPLDIDFFRRPLERILKTLLDREDPRSRLKTQGMLGAGVGVFEKPKTSEAQEISASESNLMISMAKNTSEFFHRESCGKCVPCRLGSIQVIDRIRQFPSIGIAQITPDNYDWLNTVDQTLAMTSICALGASVPNSLASVLKYYLPVLQYNSAPAKASNIPEK